MTATARDLETTDGDGHTRYRDADWLREQYHGERKTQAAIAEACGVTQGTISRWLRTHGIERRSQSEIMQLQYNDGDRRYRDRAWLREQYDEQERSAAAIARECGVTCATVMAWVRKHDLPHKTAGGDRT